MMRSRLLLVLAAVVALAGCAPKEPPPPPEPPVDPAMERRVKYFGEEVAHAPDIQWRSSGLGIKIITPGEGASPQLTDRVRVHYTGRLIDGTVFDDSRARGKPSDFVVNQLITGWSAAMPSLKPGGRAIFYVPPTLGYGGLRAGTIPPFSGLIFDVELLAVNPEPAARP